MDHHESTAAVKTRQATELPRGSAITTAAVLASATQQVRLCPDDVLYGRGDVLEYWHAGGDVVGVGVPSAVVYYYALYVGRGRLTHSWSHSDHRDFRVRVDTLESLRRLGFVIRKCTDEMNAYVEQILDLQPLRDCNSICRATSVLHAQASSRASSVSLILWARYGGAVVSSITNSFLTAFAENCGCPVHETQKGNTDSGGHYKDALQLQCSKVRSQAQSDDQENIRTSVNNSSANAMKKATSETDERSFARFLNTPVERVITTWLDSSLKAAREKRSLRGPKSEGSVALFMQTSSPSQELPAVLAYDQVKKAFTCVFRRVSNLPERLAADNMEYLRTTEVDVFQCSHYACECCVNALRRNVCPFCRRQIQFTRIVSEKIKERAARLLLEFCAEHPLTSAAH